MLEVPSFYEEMKNNVAYNLNQTQKKFKSSESSNVTNKNK
jgi:hypothetical protein